MFEIKVHLDGHELAEAIKSLAAAIAKGPQAAQVTPVQQPNQAQPEAQPAPQPAPTAVPTAAPTAQAQPQQPATQQLAAQQPAAQQPTAQPQAVPTSAPAYSFDQLAVAATQLVDAGRREELVQLLSSFGAQALTDLPQEQYGAFATKLREMGAKI